MPLASGPLFSRTFIAATPSRRPEPSLAGANEAKLPNAQQGAGRLVAAGDQEEIGQIQGGVLPAVPKV
jgi:hypothetical protein